MKYSISIFTSIKKLSKYLLLLMTCSMLISAAISIFLPLGKEVAFAEEIPINGKACYLVDCATGTEMYSSRATDKLPIASMVKIMTSLLALEAVDKGELSLDEMISVSERASSMGGSQVFLDSGMEYKASELIKSIVVASANDSCFAIAERLSGSVEDFVADMNARAKELGMTNTNFVNCTGLPAPESYSCAKDVSIMFRELIKHPAYFEFSGIWHEEFSHPDGRTTSMTNTNKLIRHYNGCDGGKTGFTSEAKFCLSATAERNGLRIVAVVIGADSSKERFASVSDLMNYAFANYTLKIIKAKDECIENSVAVLNGKEKTVNLSVAEDIAALVKKGDDGEYQVRYEIPSSMGAPIKSGQQVGKAYLTRNGEVIREYQIVARDDVNKANYYDLLKRVCEQW